MTERLENTTKKQDFEIPTYHAIDGNQMCGVELSCFESIDPVLYEFMEKSHPDHIIHDVGLFTNRFCIKYRESLTMNESKVKARVEYLIKRGWN